MRPFIVVLIDPMPYDLSRMSSCDQLVEIQSSRGNEAIEKLQSSFWPKAPTLKDIPVFHHRPEPLTESINRTLPDATILILLNIVFFLAAYASFVRQEVK